MAVHCDASRELESCQYQSCQVGLRVFLQNCGYSHICFRRNKEFDNGRVVEFLIQTPPALPFMINFRWGEC